MTRLAPLALLLALAACGEIRSEGAKPDAVAYMLPDVCMDEKSREKVRGLLSDALDAALKAHVEQVYSTWMKSLSDSGQPPRARRGTRLGITAYLHSRQALQQWSPPSC